MNNECSWKCGMFEPCEGFEKIFRIDKEDNIFFFAIQNTKQGSVLTIYQSRCPCCGSELTKPEPAEPLIERSGKTWVAYWEGVDYLLMDAELDYADYPKLLYGPKAQEIIKPIWKSFTGENPDITELTDEIAKLRPMVVSERLGLEKLYGVESPPKEYPKAESTYHTNKNAASSCYYHLATAHELKEMEK